MSQAVFSSHFPKPVTHKSCDTEPVILLVEDSQFDVELLRHAFRKAGLSRAMQIVRDGVDAMSYLLGIGEYIDRQKHPAPNILIIDLNMPRFNGLELLTWLRTQPDLQHLLVVVLTGTGRQHDIDIAYRMGAKSYLVKPTEAEEFQSLINSFYEYWIAHNHFPQPGTPVEVR
ncbi:MAG TPA: response regulator [Pyrinomonadaceae bacterium]|nr:response regulator [Pyrinomonadaceae bacterium]